MSAPLHDFGLAPIPVLSRDAAPNPARVRPDTILLDGIWTLRVNGGEPQPVSVPFAPQAKVNGIEVPDGDAILDYAVTVELPNDWEGAVLHFEGVDHSCDVSLNGVLLGRHAGAWDPFSFFVPRAALRLGLPARATALHALRVRVHDSSRRRTILSGKQERARAEGAIFYANMSGLWKSAWIERAGPIRIAGFRLDADGTGRLVLDAEIAGRAEGFTLSLELGHEDGDQRHTAVAAVAGGRARIELTVQDVRPWAVGAPSLYWGTLRLHDRRGRPLDTIETYAGFRTVEMRDGHYRVGGEPFQVQGLLNQAIYPDTLYTPTDAHTRTDFEQTIAAGFTGERRHQTTPRHRDLWLADRMGYWLSVELPMARDLLDPACRRAAIDEWRRIVEAYAWGRPSVLFLVPGNENWGMLAHHHHWSRATDDDREAFQYELGEATEACAPPGMPYAVNDGWKTVTAWRDGAPHRRLDPARLMLNLHDYAETSRLAATYGDLPAFPAPGTWGPDPAHAFHSPAYGYDGHAPLILSEVGGRALIDRPSEGVFAYGHIHRDPGPWAAELCDLIRILGAMPIVRGGYVLTQTRDAGNDPADPLSLGEVNGILDALGRPKADPALLRAANIAAHHAWEAAQDRDPAARAA